MQALHRKYFSRVLSLIAAVATLSAALCGPELTTPGTGDVSGTWHADGPAAGLSNITMVLDQATDGEITGTFTAVGTPGKQVCPVSGPCNIASTVDGANTVLQVNLELRDSGTFTGQLIGADILRGTMTRVGNSLIEFDRVN